MPLISLKTNLKDLKFGRDRLNGGSSNQPYIQFPRDEGSLVPEPYKSFFIANKTTHDFPVRGGGFLQQLSNGLGSSTIANQIDKERIEKFLKDGERGPAFIRKQTGLQLSNPRIQTSEVNPSFKLEEMPGLIQNTRLYNQGRNTLTSVQYMGNGVFLNRAGSLPFNPREKFYKDVMKEELLLNSVEIEGVNRLLILRQLKLSGRDQDPLSKINDFNTINLLGISTNRTNLFDYLGGPGSVYGVGSTTIRRAYDTTNVTVDEKKGAYIEGSQVVMNKLTYTYDNLMNESGPSRTGAKSVISNFSDFRDKIPNYAGKKLSGSYATDAIDKRFYDNRVDRINTLRPFSFDNSKRPWDPDNSAYYIENKTANKLDLSTKPNDDMIKFVFECISNDYELQNDAIIFRAHLGSINDSHKASWNGFKYLGRGENFYTYQGVDRTFGTSFKIGIGSHQELKVTYNKLNYLISQLYPDYNLNTQFMRAPLMRLTIGDYLYRAYGFLESMNLTVDDKSSWEVEEGSQLPHFINVSFDYKIIEKTLPQRAKETLTYTKFIGEPLYKTGENSIN
jgi:hypothetical protein